MLKDSNSLPLSLNPTFNPFAKIAQFTHSSVLESTFALITKSLQNLAQPKVLYTEKGFRHLLDISWTLEKKITKVIDIERNFENHDTTP